MVWNVLTEGFKMGEYDVALKRMHRVDSIKKQILQYESLLSKLVEEPDYESHFASHSETGIVYDKRIIGDNLARLNTEMDEIDQYL